MNRTRLVAAATVGAVTAAALLTAPSSASEDSATQTSPVNWHAQVQGQGLVGPVGPDAVGTLVRTRKGIRYRLTTERLNPGHVYTVWLVVVNDPTECQVDPCTPLEIIQQPETDGQVTWGKDGEIAGEDGTARFKARIPAGPLLDGWLRVQGLDDPMGADIHLVLNDHGPLIPELEEEMLTTYRAGCSKESPFPAIFPPSALADGTPGPNTCLLSQTVVFEGPASN